MDEQVSRVVVESENCVPSLRPKNLNRWKREPKAMDLNETVCVDWYTDKVG